MNKFIINTENRQEKSTKVRYKSIILKMSSTFMVHDNDSKKFLTNWQKKSPINIQVIYSYRYFK